jgi:CDP-diglyceride synthetase
VEEYPEPKPNSHEAEVGFIKRAAVVVATVGFVLLVLWFAPAIVFNLGVTVVVVLALRELYALGNSGNRISNFRRLGLVGGTLLSLQMTLVPSLPSGLSILVFLILLLSVAVLKTNGPNPDEFRELLFVMFGVLYVGGMLGQIILIRNAKLGRELTLVLILTVLAREAGAHLGGWLFPSVNLLNGSINPRKTYGGAAIGIGAAIGAAVLLSHLKQVAFTIPRAVLFGVCLGVACQFGDLTESYIKRMTFRRHSGSLLGPEGGLLDFLDAAAFAIVIACLLLHLWGYLHKI